MPMQLITGSKCPVAQPCRWLLEEQLPTEGNCCFYLLLFLLTIWFEPTTSCCNNIRLLFYTSQEETHSFGVNLGSLYFLMSYSLPFLFNPTHGPDLGQVFRSRAGTGYSSAWPVHENPYPETLYSTHHRSPHKNTVPKRVLSEVTKIPHDVGWASWSFWISKLLFTFVFYLSPLCCAMQPCACVCKVVPSTKASIQNQVSCQSPLAQSLVPSLYIEFFDHEWR